MGRIRTIKPDFFKDEDLWKCGESCMLLFAGLWVMADREGRLRDLPRTIHGEVFPFGDEKPIDEMLNTLANAQLIVRYTVDGVPLIWIPKFLEHQRPHSSEPPSRLPAMPNTAEKKRRRGGDSPPSRRRKEVEEIGNRKLEIGNTEPPFIPPSGDNAEPEPKSQTEPVRAQEQPMRLPGMDGQLSPPVGTGEFVDWYVQQKTKPTDPDRLIRFRRQIGENYQAVQELRVEFGLSAEEFSAKLRDMHWYVLTEPKKGDKKNYLRFIRNWLKRPELGNGNHGGESGLSYGEEQDHYARQRRTGATAEPVRIGDLLASAGRETA